MRNDKLNFSVIIRSFVSLLPIIFGVPFLAVITCAYNIVMSFIVFGPLTSVATSLCSVCISMLIGELMGAGGELYGFVLAMQAVLASIGCIYGYLLKKRFSLGLYLSTAGVLVPQFIYIQSCAAEKGLTVAEWVVPSVEEIKAIAHEMFTNATELDLSVGAYEINLASVFAHKVTMMIVPAAFIVSSVILAYVVMWAISVQLRKVPYGMTHSFSQIKVSVPMAIVFVFSINVLVILLPFANFGISEQVFAVLLNMIMVIAMICLFSGISFMDFFLRRAIRFTALRVLIYFGTVLFFPAVCIAYILAGCVDGFADFRKLRKLFDRKGESDEAEK